MYSISEIISQRTGTLLCRLINSVTTVDVSHLRRLTTGFETFFNNFGTSIASERTQIHISPVLKWLAHEELIRLQLFNFWYEDTLRQTERRCAQTTGRLLAIDELLVKFLRDYVIPKVR